MFAKRFRLQARVESFVEHERARWVRVTQLPDDEEAEWCVEAEALIRTVRSRVEELLPHCERHSH